MIHNYRWRLGLAEGEPKYDDLEKRLAAAPVIAVPTITLEGDANGAPHPEPAAYAKKFSGKYEHRTITGGIGHNLPQEAPEAFAKAVIDVAPVTALCVALFRAKGDAMSFITTKDGTQIFYKDWGKGQPIVFSHGWPLSADDWDTQMLFFLKNGYRVIAHDRRGHGRSTQTSDGHDMDHYADDLAALTAHLDLKERSMSATRPAAAKWCTTWRGTARAAWPKRRS